MIINGSHPFLHHLPPMPQACRHIYTSFLHQLQETITSDMPTHFLHLRSGNYLAQSHRNAKTLYIFTQEETLFNCSFSVINFKKNSRSLHQPSYSLPKKVIKKLARMSHEEKWERLSLLSLYLSAHMFSCAHVSQRLYIKPQKKLFN